MNTNIADVITRSSAEQEVLDDIVHAVASEAASAAINSGEQVEYLLTQGWTLLEIDLAVAAHFTEDS